MQYTIRIFILLFLILGFGNAGDDKSIKTTTPYAASFFEIPQIDPMKSWHFRKSMVAGIPFDDSTISLKIVWGIDSTEKNQFWLQIMRSDGSSSFIQLVFKQNDQNQLISHIDVLPYIDRNDRFPLELLSLTQSQTILYKWLNQKPVSVNIISIPTISESQIKVEHQMPEYTLESLSGQMLKIATLKGRIVVINWWSTGCNPCIEEMPGLNQLVEKYKNKKIEFISIAWNNKSEVQEFLRKKEFKYKHYIHNEIVDSIFGNSYPRNVIVDQKGFVVYDQVGGSVNSSLDIEKEIEKVITTKK